MKKLNNKFNKRKQCLMILSKLVKGKKNKQEPFDDLSHKGMRGLWERRRLALLEHTFFFKNRYHFYSFPLPEPGEPENKELLKEVYVWVRRENVLLHRLVTLIQSDQRPRSPGEGTGINQGLHRTRATARSHPSVPTVPGPGNPNNW